MYLAAKLHEFGDALTQKWKFTFKLNFEPRDIF